MPHTFYCSIEKCCGLTSEPDAICSDCVTIWDKHRFVYEVAASILVKMQNKSPAIQKEIYQTVAEAIAQPDYLPLDTVTRLFNHAARTAYRCDSNLTKLFNL